MLRARSVLWLLVADVVFCDPHSSKAVEVKLATYLATEYEALATEACRNYSLATWNYQTDVENKTKVEELVSKTVTAFPKSVEFLRCVILSNLLLCKFYKFYTL
jgi:hypothetical protein